MMINWFEKRWVDGYNAGFEKAKKKIMEKLMDMEGDQFNMVDLDDVIDLVDEVEEEE